MRSSRYVLTNDSDRDRSGIELLGKIAAKTVKKMLVDEEWERK
jgi:hypothetical protein